MTLLPKLSLVVADNRYDKKIRQGEKQWMELVARLQTPQKLKHNIVTYNNFSAQRKTNIKDVGWFLGGRLDPLQRRAANLVDRSVITLDFDHLDPWDTDSILEAYKDYEFVIHSTASSTPDAVRLRLVAPLTTHWPSDDYEPISRAFANLWSIDSCDDTTHQPCRVMFWPAVLNDAVWYFHHQQGNWADPHLLRQLAGSEKRWPRAKHAPPPRPRTKKAQDPRSKPGLIGVFCRLYSIPDAIEKFELPYVPTRTANRYSYKDGTGGAGAIYYEADEHLFTWHESDPARGNSNAWDLVRLHKFKDEKDKDTAMRELALSDEKVVKELDREKTTDFENLDAEKITENKATSYSVLSEELDKEISADSYQYFARRIAVLKGLRAAEKDILIKKLQLAHAKPKPRLSAVRDDVRKTRKELSSESTDIEVQAVEHILHEWYATGDHIRRVNTLFWVYSGGVWRAVDDERVRSAVQHVFIRLAESGKGGQLKEYYDEQSTSTNIERLWKFFCVHVTGTTEEGDPMLLLQETKEPRLNCTNGEIVFTQKGKWRQEAHAPEHMATWQVNVPYSDQANTNAWDEFCGLVFQEDDAEDQKRHLEEVCGYLIQPWRELASFGLIRGEPEAGKSTLGTLLNKMLGESVANRDLSRYKGDDQHDTAGLVGKLMLLQDDTAKGLILPDGFLKTISEAKRLTANPKFKPQFDFVCRAMPVIFCNDWPRLRDQGAAISRRALVWDIPAIPSDKRSKKARKELLGPPGLQGALKRFVQGFARLYERGDWDIPVRNTEAKARWLEDVDTVALWCKEAIETADNVKAWLPAPGLYDRYKLWIRECYPQGYIVNIREFFRRVERVLGERSQWKGQQGWRGLKEKPTDADMV